MTNKDKARKYFFDTDERVRVWDLLGIVWVLHHIDPSWKHNDVDRYEQWNIEDLIPMTVSAHTAIHMTGKVESEHTRNKKSLAHTGVKLSDEHRQAISDGLIGHIGATFSEDERNRRSDRMRDDKNIAKRPDVRKKLSENNPMKNPEICHKQHLSQIKPVMCIETGVIFQSAKEAANWCNGRPSDIQTCCRGKQQTSKGYHWKYCEKEVMSNEES